MKKIFISSIIALVIFCRLTNAGNLTEVQKTIVAASAINKMSTDVFEITLKNETGNFILSPISISQVLTMALFGAHNNTKNELKSALQIKVRGDIGNRSYHNVVEYLKGYNDTGLKMANKIYLADNFQVKPEFQEIITNKFQSETQNLDFSNSTVAANIINQWISEKTEKNIENLVESSDFNNQTMLSLINAIYFKGSWKYQFKQNHTILKPFYVNKTTSKEVPTMFQNVTVNYIEFKDLDATAIELPYEIPDISKKISMFIILPNKFDSIKEIENKTQIINKLRTINHEYLCEVKVSLPKFKIETKINLKDTLMKMGIVEAFNSNANFTGISDKDGLSISKVLQKAVIVVDEKGGEAVADNRMKTKWGYRNVHRPQECFIANRPFIFMIATRDVILLTGRVNDPTY